MKRVFAVAIIALLVITNPSFTSATGLIDEQYSLSTSGENRNKSGIIFEENVDTLRIPSFLFAYEQVETPRVSFNVFSSCTGLDDPACATANFVKYYAHMPPCKTSIEVDCIESIYAITPGSTARIEGVYQESIPSTVARPYRARPDIGLPQGSVSGVWEIPNVKHGGGSSDFVAIASQVGSLKRSGTSWIAQPAGSDLHNNGDFRAGIYPVNIVRDPRYEPIVADLQKRPDGTSGWVTTTPGEPSHKICALVGKGVCAQRQSFPDEITFGMVLRFSKVISGWMHGRIDSPDIDYKLTSYGTRVDIRGYSTRVPILAGYATVSDFSDVNPNQIPRLVNGQVAIENASGDMAINQLNIWAKALKDKAVANPTQWTLYNLSQRDIASSSNCIKESKTLAGFVTTNSTTYTATPPIFNASTGTLDYKVASPHYLADGREFLGKYNLYIDSKVARCIYKFTNAPIAASVAITYADGGQQNIATTIVNERNGWITLSALGFTFSSPTLKVKLTQSSPTVAVTPEPSAKPTVTPDPAPKASAAPVKKKTTISCVKGKVTKKISAISPKCPAGYKKN